MSRDTKRFDSPHCEVKRPTQSPSYTDAHCPHELMRTAETDGASEGAMIKTERCCWCGQVQVLHFELQQSPDHGPHAPREWKLS